MKREMSVDSEKINIIEGSRGESCKKLSDSSDLNLALLSKMEFGN